MLAAPDRRTWIGRRDAVLLTLAIYTGLRVSEITALRVDDITLGTGAHVRCQGKGRKERCTSLGGAVGVVRDWLREQGGADPTGLFPSRRGARLTRDAIEARVDTYLDVARTTCPSLQRKRVTPPRPATHDRRRTLARRQRCVDRRPLSRARVDRNDAHLPGSRLDTEGASDRQSHAPQALAVGLTDLAMPC
jgi:integrase